MSAEPRRAPGSEAGRTGRALAAGLVAGAMLGAIEAVDRTRHLEAFLPGAGERAALALLIIGWLLLAGLASGVIAAVVLRVFLALRSAFGARVTLARAVAGAVSGAALAAWGLLALTLTVRFDHVLARAPQIAVLAALAGAAAVPVALAARDALRGRVPRAAGLGLRAALVPVVLGVYFVDAYFAPQSSYGVHVLFDTLLASCVWVLAWALRPPRWLGVGLGAATFVLIPWIHHAMRNMPELEVLLRTRTAISGRVVDGASFLLDFDGDGSAARLLVGGHDSRPFDPGVPPPLPGRGAPDQNARWARPAPDTIRLPAPEDRGRAAGRPNVVLLTLDACRADVMPGMRPGAPWLSGLRLSHPALDSLAPFAARWDAAYTPSAGTEDTFNSLFTGLDLPAILAGTPDARYLPQRMVAAGYAARAFANDAHFLTAPWGWPAVRRAPLRDAQTLARELVDFLATRPAGEPGFAWFHVMDLHAEVLRPWAPASYGLSSHLRTYERGFGRVDATVRTVMEELHRRGLDRNTLVVISADHGEEFGGHGHFHHNLSVYEPAIRVPLWVFGPGVTPGRRARATALQDLYPTLLEAAGVEPGAAAGRSLWPELRDSTFVPAPVPLYSFLPHRGFSRTYALVQHAERGQAALLEPWNGHKVIVRFGDECVEAYDVNRDPLERENLVARPPAWSDSLAMRLLVRVMGADAATRAIASWR